MNEYVDKHQILQLVERGVNECFLANSENPSAFLADFFSRRGQLNIIDRVAAAEVFDSNGQVTLQVHIYVNGKLASSTTVPQGVTISSFEALPVTDPAPIPIPDGTQNTQLSVHTTTTTATSTATSTTKSVSFVTALTKINETLHSTLKGQVVTNIINCDDLIRTADGTQLKENLGKHAVVGTSVGICQAAAHVTNQQLFALVADVHTASTPSELRIPTPIVTLLDGGRHGGNKLRFQGIGVIPLKQDKLGQQLQLASKLHHALGKVAFSKYNSAALNSGHRGGLVPPVESLEEALQLITEAAQAEQIVLGEDIGLYISCGGSELVDPETKKYDISETQKFSTDELADYYNKTLSKAYCTMVVDPFHEDDVNGFSKLTSTLGKKTIIVGDDCYASDPNRIRQGATNKQSNGVILKIDQIGTVQEFVKSSNVAKAHDLTTVVGNRSGDTEATFIADLAVAVKANYVHFGGITGAQNTAKWNRLLAIERLLQNCAAKEELQ